MTPEGRVKAKVKRELASLSRKYHFMPVQNGMGAPGLDFYCCINSKFVAIETKAPGKTLTSRQEITRDNILAAGGVVYTVDDDTTIAQMMDELRTL